MTTEWLDMKFGVDVVPFKLNPKSYFLFPIFGKTNVTGAQSREVGHDDAIIHKCQRMCGEVMAFEDLIGLDEVI
jgi:hypothetical protein